MIDFFYLGEARVSSTDLVDLLELCQEYILPSFKQAIESVYASNLTIENYLDIYMVGKAFDCSVLLHDKLIQFGRSRLQELRVNRIITEIDKNDRALIIAK